jgi:hypothetical protein
MNDTSDDMARRVCEHYRSMTPVERCLVAASMYDTARALIQSSLPANLTVEQRRLAVAQRMYGDELPERALVNHSKYDLGSAQ